MTLKKRTLSEMTRDSLRYLSANTEISYFSQGSVAKAIVEATNLEMSRLQDFVSTVLDNSFLSTASGIFLDLFGEMLGITRIRDRRATASIEDGVVRFFVTEGTLGSRLPSGSPGQGLIPAGTEVSTQDGNVTFIVTTATVFPVNTRSVFVPVRATESGSSFNVGANQLTVHNLTDPNVRVSNDVSITTGSDIETDAEYKYRLSRSMTTKYSANKTAIQIVANSQAGVSRSEIVQYARGAGTFDVLLVPQGNRLSRSVIENTRRAVEAVTAYGVSPTIREPEYVAFKVMAQLRFDTAQEGQRAGARAAAESAILNYFASIPLGGELVINQLRSAILSSSTLIKDVKILELCIDGKPRVLSNIRLDKDELFVPDENTENSVQVI